MNSKNHARLVIKLELAREWVRELNLELERDWDGDWDLRWELSLRWRLWWERRRVRELELSLKSTTEKRNWLQVFLPVKQQIVFPPGTRLLRIAEIFVSKKRYETVCVLAIADWQEEYFEALDQDRGRIKFLAIRVRHTWGFCKTLMLLGLFAALGKLIKSVLSGR